MKIKDLIIIALAIVIVYLLTCNSKPVEVKTYPIEVYRTDSIRVTDTLFKTIYEPIKEIRYIGTQIDLSDTNVFKTPRKVYHYGQVDSLLSINAYISADSKPFSVKFDYNIKQFTIKDSIFIRDSVYLHTKEQLKSYISGGFMMTGSSNSFGFAPMLEYNHKKGSSFKLGYDVINANYMVGFSKKLSFSKK